MNSETHRLRLDPEAREAVSQAILITGCTRSGTTLMGRLIHSLAGVEMGNEPSTPHLLLSLIRDLPEAAWRLLWETYFFEELFLQGLAGRQLNLNRHDESSVYHAKTEDELAARLSRSHRRAQLLTEIRTARPAMKVVEATAALPRLWEYYPDLGTLIMIRDPIGVIGSTLEKGWYSDGQVHGHTGTWLLKRRRDANVPFFISDADEDRWLAMSELDRCCFCYAHLYEELIGHAALLGEGRRIVVDYDRFVVEPRRRFAAIRERLGGTYGPMTERALEAVGPRPGKRDVDLSQASPELRRRVRDIHERFRSLDTL